MTIIVDLQVLLVLATATVDLTIAILFGVQLESLGDTTSSDEILPIHVFEQVNI